MKYVLIGSRRAVVLIVVSLASPYVAAQCSGGYCANDDSPVVGGYYVDVSYDLRCTSYQSTYDGLTNCTNQTVAKNESVVGSFGAVSDRCLVNTARIEMPEGYRANNGRLYKGGSMTYVCAKADTFND